MFCLVVSKQVFGVNVQLEVSALREYGLDFSLDGLDYSFFLLRCHIFHLFFDSFGHLVAIFELLTYGNFVARVYENFNIVLQVGLMEAHYVLLLPRWDAQVYVSIADGGIDMIDDEPVAKPVKYDLVKVLRLDPKVADHARGETIPFCFRDVQSAWVIVGMIWPTFLLVHDVLLVHEPGSKCIVLNHAVHVLPGQSTPVCGRAV